MNKSAFSFAGNDAFNYENYLGPLLFEPSTVEIISQIESPNVDSVLEVAAGTGRLTKHLREYFPATTKITASDLSEDTLSLSRKKFNDQDVKFLVADIQKLPFPDNSFDLVLCQYGLMFLSDKKKGFSEVFRVLKPGGRFIFSTWDSTRNIPLINLIFNDLIIPFFKEEDNARFIVPFSLHDPEVLVDFLKVTGFTNSNVLLKKFKSGASSPEDIVNGFLLKHPLGRTIGEKDPASIETIAVEMQRQLLKKFGDGQLIFDLQAFVGSGQK
jgi:SAM-dependent methyltransferase